MDARIKIEQRPENDHSAEKDCTIEDDEQVKMDEDIVMVLQEETGSTENEVLRKDAAESPAECVTMIDNIGPKVGGDEKARPAYKRVELCIMDKVRVIAAGSTGLSQRQVAKQFGISKTQVQTLLKRKEEILRCYNEGHEGWRKRAKARIRRHSFEDINELVWKWYLEESGKGEEVTITGPMVKAKAMEISVELGLGEEFKASNGWLESLKRRYAFQIGRKHKRERTDESVESATMVTMQRDHSSEFETNNSNDDKCNEKKEFTGKEREILNLGEIKEPGTSEMRPKRKDPTIHNVFSMQRPVPIIHPVHPVMLPSPQIYQPTSAMNQRDKMAGQHLAPSSMNNLQALAEIVNQETSVRTKQIKTFSEASAVASALKAFAVETGSVTLIGLMTAMEHELEREKRNSCNENENKSDGGA